jgi:hypothetical protein
VPPSLFLSLLLRTFLCAPTPLGAVRPEHPTLRVATLSTYLPLPDDVARTPAVCCLPSGRPRSPVRRLPGPPALRGPACPPSIGVALGCWAPRPVPCRPRGSRVALSTSRSHPRVCHGVCLSDCVSVCLSVCLSGRARVIRSIVPPEDAFTFAARQGRGGRVVAVRRLSAGLAGRLACLPDHRNERVFFFFFFAPHARSLPSRQSSPLSSAFPCCVITVARDRTVITRSECS